MAIANEEPATDAGFIDRMPSTRCHKNHFMPCQVTIGT